MHARLSPGTRLATIALWPLRTLRGGVLHSITTLEIVLGGFGLVAALLAAALLSPALGTLPGVAGEFAPVAMAVVLAPLGIGVALSRRAEVERALRLMRERTDSMTSAMAAVAPAERGALPQCVVLDTSAIIDGRLTDVVETGFLMGTLVVPRFVLDELRRVADSSDPLRRQRGRRGLEALARLQASERVVSRIDETDFPDLPDVDAKLLALARALDAAILTNDFNLNRVAGVDQVPVLNLNALAQAVRSVYLPGEAFPLRIHAAGRERDQGVGYLDDGTMVVVENGRPLVGRDVTVTVTRVIQTAAGRMLFAQIAPEPAAPPPAEAATEASR